MIVCGGGARPLGLVGSIGSPTARRGASGARRDPKHPRMRCHMNLTLGLRLPTRRAALGLSIGAIAAVTCGRDSLAGGLTERTDLEAVFAENSVAGTFVLYDVGADHLTLVNGGRAKTRFVPASTFKIANTIIALETGVVKDENEIIPYGGRPQPFKHWEKDMSMRE